MAKQKIIVTIALLTIIVVICSHAELCRESDHAGTTLTSTSSAPASQKHPCFILSRLAVPSAAALRNLFQGLSSENGPIVVLALAALPALQVSSNREKGCGWGLIGSIRCLATLSRKR